mmetsp:Transcript_37585/g.55361  ORF Transcript_37585/g.55361 Transcript_37585/m.55361 type:complete len:111 (+) Transcript_37585:247-579(+)
MKASTHAVPASELDVLHIPKHVNVSSTLSKYQSVSSAFFIRLIKTKKRVPNQTNGGTDEDLSNKRLTRTVPSHEHVIVPPTLDTLPISPLFPLRSPSLSAKVERQETASE